MKRYLKLLFRGVFFLLALPASLLFFLLASISNKDATFAGFSQALSLIPGKIGTYYRAAFYSTVCKNVHRDIVVGFLTVFSHYDIEIEEGVYIGPQCNIGKCYIGKNTLIGSGVHVLSGNKQHGTADKNLPMKSQKGIFRKIEIANNCWIGNSAMISANIAPDCVIGLGSLVIKDCEKAGSVYVGFPVKYIKDV